MAAVRLISMLHQNMVPAERAKLRAAAAGTMSLEEFNQIQNGMSYEEVQKIVGSAGTVLSESSIGGISIRIVSWLGNGSLGSNAAITFQNGVVSGKSQAGLV